MGRLKPPLPTFKSRVKQEGEASLVSKRIEFKLEKRGLNRLEFLYFFTREMVDGELKTLSGYRCRLRQCQHRHHE